MSFEALLKEARMRGFPVIMFAMTSDDNCDCTLSGGLGLARLMVSGETPKEALHAAVVALRQAKGD